MDSRTCMSFNRWHWKFRNNEPTQNANFIVSWINVYARCMPRVKNIRYLASTTATTKHGAELLIIVYFAVRTWLAYRYSHTNTKWDRMHVACCGIYTRRNIILDEFTADGRNWCVTLMNEEGIGVASLTRASVLTIVLA